MVEEHDPADFYKEPKKWKDQNKLRRFYKDLVLRPLLNTLTGSKDFDLNLDDVEKYNLDAEEE
jgi:hypothetical protein